jgi:hypothetical protein
MNLGKYLFGFREEYFDEIATEIRNRQFRVYNLLALMFLVLVALSIFAGVIYGLVIFNSWYFACAIGLFLGGISFILLLLVLFLNMTTNYRSLYEKMTHMDSEFMPYYGQDLRSLSDEMATQIVQEKKNLLRETNITPDPNQFHFSNILTSTIKVVLILILSFVIGNALEMFIFRQRVNESLYRIEHAHQLTEEYQKDSTNLIEGEVGLLASWTRKMVTEDSSDPFKLIHSRSFILSFEVLQMSIGNWKITLDLLFALLFLTPIILVRKSKEYAGGTYLKEAALADISTSFLFFLLSQRKIQHIKEKIHAEYDNEEVQKMRQE